MKRLLTTLLILGTAYVGFQGYTYWNDRYNGAPYYVQVTQAPSVERQKSDDGKDMGDGYVYQFDTKDAKGQPRHLEVIDYNNPLPEKAWLKVTASKTIVNNVEVIDVTEVPVLAKK